MRLAPSSSENSVWLCRWTKVSGACGIVVGLGGHPDSRRPGVRLAGLNRGRPRRPAILSTVTPAGLSAPLRAAPHSGIREIYGLASDIPDAIHLEVGQPDHRTPAHVVEAAKRALDEGWHGYTPTAG